ncbi:MAG: transposase [Candidatus Omnitrophica bacterium]|nr:transposase [Candidatus Omnitrophota bacterium]
MDIIENINQKRIKGYLTTKQRIIFEGGIYHVTQRAPGREILFVEDRDYLYLLKLLKEIVEKFDLELYAFALLPNHLHLLLSIQQGNLSQAMKKLFERYAEYFNKKYERKGHVFCGRYRASLCNDDSYFLAISSYIHLNPYKAGLCANFKDYRWSSLRLYEDISKESFINHQKILFLVDSDIEKAREKYLEILSESIKIQGTNLLNVASLKMAIKESVHIVEQKLWKRKDSKALENLIENFRGKKRLVNLQERQTRKYLVEQLLANGYSLNEISRKLSLSRMSLHRIIYDKRQKQKSLNVTKKDRPKM